MKVCFRCMDMLGRQRPEEMPVAECGVCGGCGNCADIDLDPFTARRLKKVAATDMRELIKTATAKEWLADKMSPSEYQKLTCEHEFGMWAATPMGLTRWCLKCRLGECDPRDRTEQATSHPEPKSEP